MGTYCENTITINLIACLLPTVIHEIIHHLHPDWSEDKVVIHEDSLYQNLSFRQKKHLLTLFLWRIANGKKTQAQTAPGTKLPSPKTSKPGRARH
jgi:hypothetical protein